ncbi:MAG: LysE family translocator [Brevinemataceae bacterium]
MTFPLIPFLALVFSASFTPGPNNLMCMTLGQSLGFKNAFRYILGIIVGYYIVQLILAFSGYIIYEILPILKPIIGILGACYMSFLAFSIIKLKKPSSNKEDTEVIIPIDKLFITGLSVQFFNPKAILFGLAILSNFIFPYITNIFQILMTLAFLTFMTFTGAAIWAGSGAILSKWIHKYQKTFNTIIASALIYSAFSMLKISFSSLV